MALPFQDPALCRVSTHAWFGIVSALVLLLTPQGASAQELEPGAYWPIPAGMNVATVANSINWGDVAFDPALPVDDASATVNTTAIAYTRAFGLAGRSAQIGVVLPIVGGHVEGLYLGEPTEVGRFGQGDPRIRFAVNLYGAPAMTPKEFASYRQGTIVGVSFSIVPPLGQYDPVRVINLGNNRWSFKPEIGFSRTTPSNRWVLEAMAGIWLFTDNSEFLGQRTREQDPIVATQIHVTYKFKPTMWLGANTNYYTGGRTTVDGSQNLDLQRNSRIGVTFSTALDRRQAIRISVSNGAYTTIGAAFTSLGFSYNYAWSR